MKSFYFALSALCLLLGCFFCLVAVILFVIAQFDNRPKYNYYGVYAILFGILALLFFWLFEKIEEKVGDE